MTTWISRKEVAPPKDGTWIIAVYESRWMPDKMCPELLRWREYPTHSLEGWVRTDGTIMGNEFTHWYPLPPLPESEEREK